MIPCLNTSSEWVQALADWIAEYKSGSQRLIMNEVVTHKL
jgi:hypothetical protein